MFITESDGQSAKVHNPESGKTYSIGVDGNGSAKCTCPSFRFGNHWCKHLAFVYDQLKGTPA